MKTVLMLALGLTGAILSRTAAAEATIPVTDTHFWHDEGTGLTIVAGEVELPSNALWQAPPDQRAAGALREILLAAPAPVLAAIEGERLGEINERRSLKQASFDLSGLHGACRRYAGKHDGIGPATFSDLDPKQLWWLEDESIRSRYALVPRVPLPERTWKIPRNGVKRQPLAFELQPEIDDGKHWIVWNDGQTRRVEIDPKRVKQYSLNIVPRGLSREARLARLGKTGRYQVLARRATEGSDAAGDRATWTVCDRLSGREMTLVWEPGQPAAGEAEILHDWAQRRVAEWRTLNRAGSAFPLSLWLQQAESLYGVKDGKRNARPPRRRGNQTTLFNVLGGRAAIRETLQMQDLTPAGHDTSNAAETVAIDSLPSVSVKAHEYEKMLAGRPGGRLPLADLVPHDRFFAWFPDPGALLPFLDSGSDFLFHLSSGFTGRSVRYGLLDRYLGRLGMNEPFLRSLLKSGALADVALFTPDLFFIDGTDLTAVARLKEPARLAGLLKLIGLGELQEITPRRVGEGVEVFWLRRGDLLFISTQRSELEHALALHDADGRGSLGQSAEFRYLLTQLPPGEQTRGFLYFSDPFLRRLTGPAVKIGQCRGQLLFRPKLAQREQGDPVVQQAQPADAEFCRAGRGRGVRAGRGWSTPGRPAQQHREEAGGQPSPPRPAALG